MKVQFQYFAQVRAAAGVEFETLELPTGATLQEAMLASATRHGEGIKAIALDAAGKIRPSLIVLVNDAPAGQGGQTALQEGDRVSIFSPVAGG